MSERTDPSDALERLAWTLNYREGETLSVNELANKTDLSWATAKKYTQLLERLSRISPSIETTDDGVSVNSVGDNLACIRDRPETQLIVYLLTHAEFAGGAREPFSIENHRDVLSRYEETLSRLQDIGWVEVDENENTIRLTPTGLSQAGPARSKLRNTNVESPSVVEVADKGEIIRTSDAATKSNWASGDYATDQTTQGTGIGSSPSYNNDFESANSSDNWSRP